MDLQNLYRRSKDELPEIGKNPIEDVGRILNFVQSMGVSEKDVNSAVQYIYTRLYQENGLGDQNQARQSWVTASGNSFEIFVRNLVNSALNEEGIIAVKGDQLRSNQAAQDMVRFLTLRANRRCTQTTTGVWPDSDIVVLTKERSGRLKAFALLNCKTSDHSRNDAVLFWALALRDTNIKYCLVTQDLDRKFVKGDNDASSLRRKAEAYLDRVYTTHPDTDECSQVRKLDFSTPEGTSSLLSDLRSWRKDIVPDFVSDPISQIA